MSGPGHREVSDILLGVRNSLWVFALAAFGAAIFVLPTAGQATGQPTGTQEAQPAQNAPQPVPIPQTPLAPPVAAAPPGPVIVLDPAHGGTDTGARGEAGLVEKDIVLQMARTVREELERRDFHVVMTRNDDSNPSYDDRAATANGFRDAIFISLHVSSTGTVGTVRAYYDQFATPFVPAVLAIGAKPVVTPPPAVGLTSWEEAQRAYVGASHHLADLTQIEIANHFASSPDTSIGVPVRALRSIAAPAIAIEISSVAAQKLESLTGLAGPLADAIARAIAASRATPGAK